MQAEGNSYTLSPPWNANLFITNQCDILSSWSWQDVEIISWITDFLCCLRGWALWQWLWSILNDSVKGFTCSQYWNCSSTWLYRAVERVQVMPQQLTPRLLRFTLTAVIKSYPDATGWCFSKTAQIHCAHYLLSTKLMNTVEQHPS